MTGKQLCPGTGSSIKPMAFIGTSFDGVLFPEKLPAAPASYGKSRSAQKFLSRGDEQKRKQLPTLPILVICRTTWALDIQIGHVQGVVLDKAAALFHHIAHQLGEDLVGCVRFVYFHSEQ